MLLVSRSDVERHLTMPTCIDLMRAAMIAASAGGTTQIVRSYLPVPGAPGKMAIMPGTMSDPACFGVKLVCKYNRAADDPLGTHVGMVMLFDSVKGIPLAMVEGSALTGIRTAAASGLATDLLARARASRLAILGTGEQALRHVHAMTSVRRLDHIAVWGRDNARTEAFAERVATATGVTTAAAPSVPHAIDGADIVCTTTASTTPILFGEELQPGQHLNLVGAAVATAAEVDHEAVRRSRVFVDSRESAMAAAGEVLEAIARGVVGPDHIAGEIGAVAAGLLPGRRSEADITIYKSLGIAAQDLASAHYLWRTMRATDTGFNFDLLA